MISVRVIGGDMDRALAILKKIAGPHLRAVARRAKFPKPSERKKEKAMMARKRRMKREANRRHGSFQGVVG